MTLPQLPFALAMLASLGGISAIGGEILTFVTAKGQEYKDVELSKVEWNGIVIATDAGVERVPFENLPLELQKRFGYNAAAVAAEKEKIKRTEEMTAIIRRAQQARQAGRDSVDDFMELEWPVMHRKFHFVKEILESDSETQTEFEKAKFEYAEQVRDSWVNPKSLTLEDILRMMDLHSKNRSVEPDIPAHLLSEAAFNEWKKKQVQKGK